MWNCEIENQRKDTVIALVMVINRSLIFVRCQSMEEKTSGNILDNASNLLTNLLSGGSLSSMPTAEGAVSDLFGKPLFLSLYDWFLEVYIIRRTHLKCFA